MATLLSKLNLNHLTLTPTLTATGRKMIAVKLDDKPLLLQLNDDETDLFSCPFGLDRESEKYPDPENRILRLVPSVEKDFQKLDAFFAKQYEANFAAWGLPSNLEYAPLVKCNDDIGPMIRTKVSLQHTVFKKFHDSMQRVVPSDVSCITPGSECLLLVKASSLWYNESKYGVTLNVKLILVKPGEKKNFDITDLILQSHIESMEE